MNSYHYTLLSWFHAKYGLNPLFVSDDTIRYEEGVFCSTTVTGSVRRTAPLSSGGVCQSSSPALKL